MASRTCLLLFSSLLVVPACVDDAPGLGAGQAELAAGKVTICHLPPGNPANAHELTVGAPAVEAHLAHGDFLGTCAPSCTPAPETCGDGLDNDCDGAIDDGCCVAVAEVCGDGLDNDCDGAIDDGCIGDLAWEDADRDGLQSAGETGLPGATFILRTTSGAVVAVTTSDATGTYWFTGVPAGEYLVEVVPPSGWMPTDADVGGDDRVDSDFDKDTLVTDPFVYDGGALRDVDAGLVPAIQT